jgi:plasmid stabilization system protein ParE
MAHQIVWEDDAKENYRAIANYLLDTFPFDVAERFTDSIADKLRILEQMPFVGRRLDTLPAVRKLPLPPYNTIYYAVVGEQVIILNIVDNRRG